MGRRTEIAAPGDKKGDYLNANRDTVAVVAYEYINQCAGTANTDS
jgi:hypothetical protein